MATENKTEKDHRKQSIYMPLEMIEEIKQESARLDRSLSWTLQRAWTLAKNDIAAMPSVDPLDEG